MMNKTTKSGVTNSDLFINNLFEFIIWKSKFYNKTVTIIDL